MSHGPDARAGVGRRRFLRGASVAGTAPVWAGVASRRSAASRVPGEVVPGDGRRNDLPGSDVSHEHVGEFPTVRRQLGRFEASGDPSVLYDPALDARLAAGDDGPLDVVVRTVGERTVRPMGGPVERTIHGWRPRGREVERLAAFGDVGFVAEVSATTVSVRGVAREDLPALARLPFVLDVAWDPPVSVGRPPTRRREGVPLSALRGADYFRFSELPGDLSVPSSLRIGIVDRGYGGPGSFDEAHAASVGIDEDLATDFTDEDEWRNEDGHGTDVANTCAYLLPDGHDDLFVPLKVITVDEPPVRPAVQDHIRSAIEYAEKNGIAVLNVSLETSTSRTTCPSTYCAELYSYVDAGFLPFAAIGNRDTEGVKFPGGERLTIGVGGIHESCPADGSYERYVGEDGYYGSSYGVVKYREPVEDETHCHYCHHHSRRTSGFAPAVYGCYLSRTDADETLAGTSFASPQAAAVGAVMLANGVDGYEEATSVFEAMDRHGICPPDAAGAGQLLDARRAYDETAEDGDRRGDGSTAG